MVVLTFWSQAELNVLMTIVLLKKNKVYSLVYDLFIHAFKQGAQKEKIQNTIGVETPFSFLFFFFVISVLFVRFKSLFINTKRNVSVCIR